MKTFAKYSGRIVLFMGIFLVAKAGWYLFHGQALQAVFDIAIGFYLIQDSRIDSLKGTVNILVAREIERSEKEMLNGEGPNA